METPNIESHRVEAYHLIYAAKRKAGEAPEKKHLGGLTYDASADNSIEWAEILVRREFPKANWFRLFNSVTGDWICSSSI